MRKFYVLSMALACCHLTINAQVQKGRVLLGGHLSAGSNTAEFTDPAQQKQETNSGNFMVAVGKAINENTVIGFNAGYNFSNQDNYYGADSKSKIDGYSIGVFYRKYRKLAGAFFYFGEAEAGYFGSKQVITYPSPTPEVNVKNYSAQIALTPGLSYAVTKKIRAEISIPGAINANYSVGKFTNANQEKQHSFNINSSLEYSFFNSLALGFRIVL